MTKSNYVKAARFEYESDIAMDEIWQKSSVAESSTDTDSDKIYLVWKCLESCNLSQGRDDSILSTIIKRYRDLWAIRQLIDSSNDSGDSIWLASILGFVDSNWGQGQFDPVDNLLNDLWTIQQLIYSSNDSGHSTIGIDFTDYVLCFLTKKEIWLQDDFIVSFFQTFCRFHPGNILHYSWEKIGWNILWTCIPFAPKTSENHWF
jgi:hypothetical protein